LSENESPQKNNPAEQRLAVRLFDARELGESLREVATDIIRAEEQNVESRWFHSKKDVDLFIWKDQSHNIIKQQVTFYGQLVEWNVIEGLRTGLIVEDETSQGISASPLIRYDSAPQPHSIEQGVDIIGYIQLMADEDKLQLIENFIRNPHFAMMKPENILQRYGLHLRKSKDQSLWRRLLNRLGLSGKKK
jgi:hypothetical protein